MYIPGDLLPFNVLLAGYFLWLSVLGTALWRATWARLQTGNSQHAFLGAVVALLLLWRFDVGVTPGLGFHFLGVTVFTLMFGWTLAVIGISLVSLGTALSGAGFLEPLGVNALLFGVLPVTVSYGIYRLVHGHLPNHVFVYIFLCAFFGAILTAAVTVFSLVGMLTLTQVYDLTRISEEYLPFLPLYLFPEGLLNGTLTTIMIALRPQWLSTFDDETYLKR
jgi:uncharacterized membrane protein